MCSAGACDRHVSSWVRRPRPLKPLKRHRRPALRPAARQPSVLVTRPLALAGHGERTASAHPHRGLAHPVGARQPHQQGRPHPPGRVSACRARAPRPRDTPAPPPRAHVPLVLPVPALAPREQRGVGVGAPGRPPLLGGPQDPLADARRVLDRGISTWCLKVTSTGRGPEDGRADGPGPTGRSSGTGGLEGAAQRSVAEAGLRVKRTRLSRDRGSPPTSSASSSSLTNDVAKQPASRDPPPGRPGAAGTQYTPHSHQFPRTRKMFDKGPDQVRPRGPGARRRAPRASHPGGTRGLHPWQPPRGGASAGRRSAPPGRANGVASCPGHTRAELCCPLHEHRLGHRRGRRGHATRGTCDGDSAKGARDGGTRSWASAASSGPFAASSAKGARSRQSQHPECRRATPRSPTVPATAVLTQVAAPAGWLRSKRCTRAPSTQLPSRRPPAAGTGAVTPVLGQRGRRRHAVPPPGGSGALSLRPTCGLSSGRVPLRVTRSPATRAPCGLLAPSPVRRAPPATAMAPTAPAAGRGPTHRPGGSAGRWTTQKSWWPIPPLPEPLPSSGRRAPGLGGAAAPRQRPVGPRARGHVQPAQGGWQPKPPRRPR